MMARVDMLWYYALKTYVRKEIVPLVQVEQMLHYDQLCYSDMAYKYAMKREYYTDKVSTLNLPKHRYHWRPTYNIESLTHNLLDGEDHPYIKIIPTQPKGITIFFWNYDDDLMKDYLLNTIVPFLKGGGGLTVGQNCVILDAYMEEDE